MKNYPRLGVNIDHIATIRQQRGELYPSVTRGAEMALFNGADQITIHLREDRRHIQDQDVGEVLHLCRHNGRPLNLEMGANSDILSLALEHQPDWICLVPEKRQERTTEGGLDLENHEVYQSIDNAVKLFKQKSPQTKISLFIEAKSELLYLSKKLGAQAVEIHTGKYAHCFNKGQEIESFSKLYQELKIVAHQLRLGFHAGHGLTDKSVEPLLKLKIFEEYNIGHWMIAESLFIGLGEVTKNLVSLFEQYPLD